MNVRNWFIGGILLLSVIGLGSYLVNNPLGLFRQVLFIGLLVAIVFIIYRVWTAKSPGGKAKNSFAKAAKQSKKRIASRQSTARSSSQSRNKPLRRKSAAHLTVIEGNKDKNNKNKKNNRAIF